VQDWYHGDFAIITVMHYDFAKASKFLTFKHRSWQTHRDSKHAHCT